MAKRAGFAFLHVRPYPLRAAQTDGPAQWRVGRRAPSVEHFENPFNSFGYLLRIAFRSFSRALERRTLPVGVTSGQWRFLRVLWAEDGFTQIELSRRVGMREPTTVAAVNGLELAGYVVRRKSATDRRKVHVYLTARAKRLKAKLLPFVAEVNALGLKGLTPQQVTTLRKSLLKIIDNLSVTMAIPIRTPDCIGAARTPKYNTLRSCSLIQATIRSTALSRCGIESSK